MAEEKVDYKNDRISAMISRQFERGTAKEWAREQMKKA